MGTLSIKPRTPTKLQGIHGHGTVLRQSLVWAWWKTQALFALIDSKTPEDHGLDTRKLLPLLSPLHQYPILPPVPFFSRKSQQNRFLPSRDWVMVGAWGTTKFKGEMALLVRRFRWCHLICFLHVATRILSHTPTPKEQKAHLGGSQGPRWSSPFGEKVKLS